MSKKHQPKKEAKEEKLHKIPLRITDTTFRDAHQSLWATRMRTDDIMNIIDTVDNVGYYSLEVWGGATFDVCLRFLRENPWERLRMIKSKAKKTPLQMLLRGQNLVGYRNYADDVVDRFVALACENGMDIFRVFDALNDTRNLESAVKAVKKHGGHAQGTLSYTISPVHTIEKYIEYAKEQVAIGIDSLVIKDMAGILTPFAAERLVGTLIKEVRVPIQLHCHSSSGMATATYVEAVRAGAGAIDCAISTLAGFSSQPPVEALATIFSETSYSPDLDMDALQKVATFMESLAPKRIQRSASRAVIDPHILVHQIPGGMISNFRSQLDKQGALDKLPEVFEEVTRVRKDLGYPPLVTPTSQIVGTMAVVNVVTGKRYKMVPNEVKDYVRGLYGRSPGPVDPEFVKQIMGDEKPVDHRPADNLPPMLPKATAGLDPELIEHEEDILSYCVLPKPSLEYFKWRKLPPDQRPEIPADTELRQMGQEEQKIAQCEQESAARSKVEEKVKRILDPVDYSGISELLANAQGIAFDELVIAKGDFSLTLHGPGAASKSARRKSIKVSESIRHLGTKDVVEETSAEAPGAPKSTAEPETGTSIISPLVGTFYSAAGPGKPRFVSEGDIVEKGDKVCIVEAMKLFNEIEAPIKCRIVKFLIADGENVKKDQPLISIEELQ
ncbi:MAG: pyruvate carboxylase subunit B [Chitinivibrionales bacterium]|nr:pyruvate carboxylase subunit B [Chitinivibrionales bacterium]